MVSYAGVLAVNAGLWQLGDVETRFDPVRAAPPTPARAPAQVTRPGSRAAREFGLRAARSTLRIIALIGPTRAA
jgi:hypothetical protein